MPIETIDPIPGALTINQNFLTTHRFKIVLQRAPNVVFFCQQANLPGIAMGNATQPSPFVDLPVPGDKITFEDFVVTFIVDEDMANYKEVASWIVSMGFPSNFGQYSPNNRSAISLVILDSQYNAGHTATFFDAFPVSISSLAFSTTAADSLALYCTVVFKYAYWSLDEVNNVSGAVTASTFGVSGVDPNV